MRLNGIEAEPGTVMGLHFREKRLLIVDEEFHFHPMILRFNSEDELIPKREPRSVAEHHLIPRKMTPYGLVRQYTPNPRQPVKIEFDMPKLGNRAMRRAFNNRKK